MVGKLTEAQRRVMFRCLVAICEGPFLDEEEFGTRMGLDRPALALLIRDWPAVDDSDDRSDAALLINNSMNEIVNGLDLTPSDWTRWFGGQSRDSVETVYRAWAGLRGWDRTGIR